jgi:pectinesterase
MDEKYDGMHIGENDLVIEGKQFSGGHYARALHADGKPYHTFRTYTLLADGDRLTFRNCVFENTAGPGEQVGQAIALYLDGDDICLEDCVIRGHQDTLFLAPLPIREHEPDGFLGPKRDTPRLPRRMWFKNCLIEGGVDFIFGGAAATFENCEFRSVEPGYVFAPSTPEGEKAGFVARNCRFTASENVPDGSCFIARPWRKFGKVRLENCFLGNHINEAGWDDWGKPEAHATVKFEETGSYGPGACREKRPEYVKYIL